MNSVEVDEEVLNRIFTHVRLLEGNNLKTGEFSDKDMVKKIIQIIDSEIRKGGEGDEV